MPKYTTPAQRIADLVNQHGGYRAVSELTGVSTTHLFQVAAGNRNASHKVTDALGLIRDVKYRVRRA